MELLHNTSISRGFFALKQVQSEFMKSISLLLLGILSFAGNQCIADEVRYYDIEVIVFESLDEYARISENWPHEVDMETPPLVVELDRPYPGPIPKQFDRKMTFRVTPENQLQLLTEAKLLTDSKNYRVLLHTGWRQPGMDADSALPVHISKSFIVNEVATRPTTTSPDMPAMSSAPTQTRSTLDGYIKVILSRYLHMDVKLAYTTKIPMQTELIPARQPEGEDVTPISPPKPIVYFLDETRKMRSKEVHYLDHPVLGVILLATPYETGSR